jgi:UDP-N-acetylmuramoyl-tripeptide--D-alanyl-D-alanine ligase
MSATLISLLHAVFPFRDFLYLLQLEEYHTRRYLKLLPRFYSRRKLEQRDQLKVTSRIELISVIAIWLWIYPALMALLIPTELLIIFLAVLASTLLIPVWVVVASVLTSPLYFYFKWQKQQQAKELVAKHPELIIIGVAGSFGKTTTKNFIYDLIKFNYRTQLVPGNINTPAGIANWLLQNLKPGIQILIVEMDSYFIGEIARSCEITPPNIAVLTNIGDQHLERLGSRNNLAKALIEIFKYAKPGAKLITSSTTVTELTTLLADDATQPTHVVDLAQQLSYKGAPIATNIDSSSARQNLHYALLVAELLDIPTDFVIHTCQHLQLPERRQRVSELYGFTVIDDSYNISFTTAQAGLSNAKTLAEQYNKQLLVITGGIPELGKENKDSNKSYGQMLANQADYVVVLNTILAKQIHAGLQSTHGQAKIATANSMQQAWELIQQQYQPTQIVVLMQPELNDLYY